MIEADRADYNRAKLDHDLIVAITTPPSYPAREGHGRFVQLLRALKSVVTPDAQLSHQP